MKNNHIKKNDNVIKVEINITALPSNLHKYGAIRNKAQVFDDRRKRKPKYKHKIYEDF